MLIQSLAVAIALAAAQTAPSQTVPTQTGPTQTTPASAPNTVTPGVGARIRVSDEEVTQFASAASSIKTIRADTNGSDADRNRRVTNLIKATGLTSARFDQIAQAMQADPALNKRIQAEIGEEPPTP